MHLFRKRYKKLAIIGNGFDLNHGYRTDYKTFAANTQHPSLARFKDYCDTESIETWYSFEENIRILSEEFFLRSMSEYCDFDDNREEVRELTDTFRDIHDLLSGYLASEIATKPLEKKPCIEQYLDKNTVAINFNYTDTAEAYTPLVRYVHGSLKENDVLLGYDYREEPCLAQYEDMCWSKAICRESLAFRRHILKWIKPESKLYKKLISGLNAYHHWENTGRGLDKEVRRIIPYCNTIERFLKKYRKRFDVSDIRFSDIETLVVLGHGIEADKVFLTNILERCTGLTTIVLYRYNGESDASIFSKTEFFRPYCEIIELVDY